MTRKLISLKTEFDKLTFLSNRTPRSTESELEGAFAQLSNYRDSGIFIGYYAGKSEWEKHPQGDEIVYVLEGATILTIITTTGSDIYLLSAGEMLIVPRGLWHRFETPDEVKIMSVTPQPTIHSVSYPTE